MLDTYVICEGVEVMKALFLFLFFFYFFRVLIIMLTARVDFRYYIRTGTKRLTTSINIYCNLLGLRILKGRQRSCVPSES